MQIRALELLLEWGVANIQQYCYEITREPLNRLMEMGCHIEDTAYRAAHLTGIHLPAQLSARRLKKALFDHQVFLSLRGNAIRISPNVYNNQADIAQLLAAFEALQPFS